MSEELKPPCDCCELQGDSWVQTCDCLNNGDLAEAQAWCTEVNLKKNETTLQTLHAALVDAVLKIGHKNIAWATADAVVIARTIRRISEGKETRPIAEIWKELGVGE